MEQESGRGARDTLPRSRATSPREPKSISRKGAAPTLRHLRDRWNLRPTRACQPPKTAKLAARETSPVTRGGKRSLQLFADASVAPLEGDDGFVSFLFSITAVSISPSSLSYQHQLILAHIGSLATGCPHSGRSQLLIPLASSSRSRHSLLVASLRLFKRSGIISLSFNVPIVGAGISG